jgi:hypothetical protein
MGCVFWKYDREARADVMVDPDIEPFIGENGHCMICGDRNTMAYWAGPEGNIAVCFWCAEKVLPKIIADAYVAQMYRSPTPNLRNDPRRVVGQILSSFWQALAEAMTQKGFDVFKHYNQSKETEGIAPSEGEQ